MHSMSVISSSNACSVSTGGNLWYRKPSTNNIYYTSGNHRQSQPSIRSIYHASSYATNASQYERKTRIEYNFWRFQQSSLKHHYGYIRRESTYQECKEKYVVNATDRPYSDFEPDPSTNKNILDNVKNFFSALFMFTTPYALATQTLSLLSASLLAIEKLSDISSLFFIAMLKAVVPNLFMTIYVAGLNQLCDLEIDKINKPYLPLASGQMSVTTGVGVVGTCLTLCLGLCWIIGSWPLFWGMLSCCLLSIGYSINVPLLRWKGNPLLAAMCIFIAWTIIFPISFFLHMQTFVFKRPPIFPRSLITMIAFMGFYSIGIALCKDIPDIEGDTKFGIYSFSSRFGQKRVFWICIFLFEMAFGVALLAGATSPYNWSKIVTGLGHAILASIVWYQAKSVDLGNKASTSSFYFFIWKLLSVEYLLMPFIR